MLKKALVGWYLLDLKDFSIGNVPGETGRSWRENARYRSLFVGLVKAALE